LSDANDQSKRARLELDSIDDMIDPALTNGDTSALSAAIEDYACSSEVNGLGTDSSMIREDDMEARSSENDAPNMQLMNELDADGAPAAPVDAPSPRASSQESVAIKSEVEHGITGGLQTPPEVDNDLSRANHGAVFTSPAKVKTSLSLNESCPGNTPTSRHSSRQTKQIERYTPEIKRSPGNGYAVSQHSERRASSVVSAQTMATSVKSRRSSSNTSRTTHQMAGPILGRSTSREASARPVSRGSTGDSSEMNADEKFARELQAAENGLRRRTSMRS
jgi:hypothetical protein